MAEGNTPNKGITNEKVRLSLYHVTAAVLAIVGIFGLITAEEAEQYLQAAVLILGVAPTELAAVNTPKKKKPSIGPHDVNPHHSTDPKAPYPDQPNI